MNVDQIQQSLDTGNPPLAKLRDAADAEENQQKDLAGVVADTLFQLFRIRWPIDAKHKIMRVVHQAYAVREAVMLDRLARANFFLDCHTTGERGANHCGFDGTYVCTVCHNADLEAELVTAKDDALRLYHAGCQESERADRAEAELATLRDGLQRIVKRETVVEGLRPEFYGHARQIAKETLKAVQAEGGA